MHVWSKVAVATTLIAAVVCLFLVYSSKNRGNAELELPTKSDPEVYEPPKLTYATYVLPVTPKEVSGVKIYNPLFGEDAALLTSGSSVPPDFKPQPFNIETAANATGQRLLGVGGSYLVFPKAGILFVPEDRDRGWIQQLGRLEITGQQLLVGKLSSADFDSVPENIYEQLKTELPNKILSAVATKVSGARLSAYTLFIVAFDSTLNADVAFGYIILDVGQETTAVIGGKQTGTAPVTDIAVDIIRSAIKKP